MNSSQTTYHRKLKFFRVLLTDFTHKLSLPHKGIRHLVQGNSACATLLSPLGKSWHVRIKEDNQTLIFGDGWEKFAKDHKLSLGDFLVFKHKGSLIFDVTIFDPTTCERDYTAGSTNGIAHEKVSPVQEEIPCGEEINHNTEADLQGFVSREASCDKKAAELMEPLIHSKHRSSGVEKLREQRRDHKAPNTKTGDTRRFQFEVVLALRHRRYVEIPAAFKASNKLANACQIFLEDPKGKVWPAKIRHRRSGSCMRSEIREDWPKLRAANCVEDGDVCIFELKKKNVLHVHVHKKDDLQTQRREGLRSLKAPQVECHQRRRPKSTEPPSHQATVLEGTAQDRKPLAPTGNCTPSPCFMSKIRPSHGGGNLTIPSKFLSLLDDFSAARQVILVDPQSRQWPVNVSHTKVKSGEYAQLGLGWRQFCSCNIVQAGDVCIFKLTSGEGCFVFHVDVIKPPSSKL